MKRNPYVLAPFLAPYHATKGRSYYSAMLLAKYAAILASGSILFHVHACFSLQRAVVTALAPNGTTTAQLNFMSQEWWAGRLLLLALSVILQKLPIAVVSTIFRIDGVRGGGVSCEMCACMLSFLPRYRVSVFIDRCLSNNNASSNCSHLFGSCPILRFLLYSTRYIVPTPLQPPRKYKKSKR